MSVELQELDNKTIQRIEKAVAKSEYSQGKKLKVVTKVGYSIPCYCYTEWYKLC